MGVLVNQARFVNAQLLSLVYAKHCAGRLLQAAKPDTMRYMFTTFHGRSVFAPASLYRKMGINEFFHDGELKILFLSREDYVRYDTIRGESSSGTYHEPPQIDYGNLIGRDITPLFQARDNAKTAVVPVDADLATLFHETLHDIYARKLTTPQVDLFIETACRALSAVLVRKRLICPERVLFRQVASHAGTDIREVITPDKLADLKHAKPGRPLTDTLKKRDATFFCELFPMAAEIAFGYDSFLGGTVPDSLLNYYSQINLRHPSAIGRYIP